MFRLQSRPVHYALLAAAHLLLTLPNLGGPTLWDMDEGVNAEAGREMLESGNWITPQYNYEIRTAKPALLCWLHAASFSAFGVDEFAARLPAVLCGLGSVWFTYELGRRMFAPTTGLIAGLVLASCIEFCLISHAATPDPPLILFLTGALFFYWAGSEGDRRWWFIPTAALCGLATLAKGPIGVGIPGLVILLHLAWTRQLGKLWDRRLLAGALTFILVAAPWYGFVALDTKGAWVKAFFLNENLNRFSTPADGHRGPPWLHAAMLIALFAPWSTFLIPTFWWAVREARRPLETPADPDTANKYRFLLVWFLVVLTIFSIAATKLPNYILPLYPALAVLTARWLDRWRTGELTVPRWVPIAAAAGCVLVGVVYVLALMLMAGTITAPFKGKAFGSMPTLGPHVWIGIIPIVVGVWFGWQAVRDRRTEALAAFAAGAVAFLGLIGARATNALEDYKVSRHLAEEVGLRQTDRDIRIGAFGWLRHSVVFYVRREVTRFYDPRDVDEFLALPRPAYVIVPEDAWELRLSKELTTPVTIIARRYDMYIQKDVLVIANRYALQ